MVAAIPCSSAHKEKDKEPAVGADKSFVKELEEEDEHFCILFQTYLRSRVRKDVLREQQA